MLCWEKREDGKPGHSPLSQFVTTILEDYCLLQMMLASLIESDVTDIRIECWMMSVSAVMLGADGRIEEM